MLQLNQLKLRPMVINEHSAITVPEGNVGFIGYTTKVLGTKLLYPVEQIWLSWMPIFTVGTKLFLNIPDFRIGEVRVTRIQRTEDDMTYLRLSNRDILVFDSTGLDFPPSLRTKDAGDIYVDISREGEVTMMPDDVIDDAFGTDDIWEDEEDEED